jgi:hypothetical protein
MDEINLDRDLADLELSEIGMTVKAAFDLRKALDKAMDAIRGKQARSAIAALRSILENVEEYGYAYGYGYPAPKAAKDAEKIKTHAQQAIDALDQDEPDFEKAIGLVQRIEKELGHGKADKAAPKEATRLRDRIMSAVGELNKDEPDYEKVGKVLQDALEKLPGKPEEKKSDGGMAVKTLREEGGGVVVGGYLLLWGDPEKKDLAGDYFTPETQLWLEEYKSVPALFHHGLDDEVGLTVMGHRVKAAADDVGVWVEDWLDKSKKYWQMVKPLLEAEALFYSPGSAPHLVEREKDGKLKSFPVVEDTMTPVPCQHRLLPLGQIKAVYEQSNITLPEALAAEPLDVAAELEALEQRQNELEV